MSLFQYLSNFDPAEVITLVGPLLESRDANYDFKEPVIFVDGGVNARKEQHGISVGDGDSAGQTLDIMLNPDKDFSDLAYVLQQIPIDYGQLNLMGFLGGRRDHELFNLGEVHRFLDARKEYGKITFHQKVIGFASGEWQFQRHGGFSVGVLRDTLITLSGDCLYQCNQPTQFTTLSSLGLSNSGSGTINIRCDAPVYLFLDDLNQ